MIQPKDFLDFAQGIFDSLKDDGDCAEVRNCISRSYYYVFHLGREKFKDDKRADFDRFAKVYDHQILINFFDNLKHKDISARLSRFRAKRNDADYRFDYNLTKSDAEEWLKTAKTIATRINNISPQL